MFATILMAAMTIGQPPTKTDVLPDERPQEIGDKIQELSRRIEALEKKLGIMPPKPTVETSWWDRVLMQCEAVRAQQLAQQLHRQAQDAYQQAQRANQRAKPKGPGGPILGPWYPSENKK